MAIKKNRKWLWIALASIGVLVAFAVYKAKSRPNGEKVYTEEVVKREIREIVSASGKIYPKTEVKISSDVSGEIVALYVKEGDTVKAGQLLAKIDPDAYVSQVDRGVASLNVSKSQIENSRKALEAAKAQRDQVSSQVENARLVFERNKKLHNDGVISDVEFQASQSSYKALEANLKSANASIAQAEENVRTSTYSMKGSEATLKEVQKSLSRTSILAPTSGIISKLNVEKGERVVGTIQMTGTEMMRIANLNIMEVQAEVSENDILRVQLGNDVNIEVDAYPNKKFKGKVTEISNSSTTAGLESSSASLATDKITNYIVKIIIDQSSYSDLIVPGKGFPFRPGMSASVEITTNIVKDAICVPIQAVTTREIGKDTTNHTNPKADDLKEVVFVPTNDTARMVEVSTGIQDEAYIQVLSGIKPGEKVVAGPYSVVSRTLKSGKKIVVVKKDEINSKSKKPESTED